MANATIIVGAVVGSLDWFNAANLFCTLANGGANYLFEFVLLCWNVASYHGLDADFGTERCAKHRTLMDKLGRFSSCPFNLLLLEGLSIDLQWMIKSKIKHNILDRARGSGAA